MSVPSAPDIVRRPRAFDGALQFWWAPPLSDGGSAITGYTLECSAASLSIVLGNTAYTHMVSGLTNFTDYTFTLKATNENGAGPVATFRTVQPCTILGAPTGLSANTDGVDGIVAQWTNATFDGRILRNLIKAVPTDDSSPVILSTYGTQTTRRFGGLDTNKSYRIHVKGFADSGYSPEIISDIVTFDGGGGGGGGGGGNIQGTITFDPDPVVVNNASTINWSASVENGGITSVEITVYDPNENIATSQSYPIYGEPPSTTSNFLNYTFNSVGQYNIIMIVYTTVGNSTFSNTLDCTSGGGGTGGTGGNGNNETFTGTLTFDNDPVTIGTNNGIYWTASVTGGTFDLISINIYDPSSALAQTQSVSTDTGSISYTFDTTGTYNIDLVVYSISSQQTFSYTLECVV